MKKRVFLLILSALLLLGGFPFSVRAEDRIEIDSRAALEAIADNPAGHYVLTADLNLDGTEWTPIPLTGSFDGNGHTLYNLRVRSVGDATAASYDGNRKEYETVFGGLFSTVIDAAVMNLNLVNADVAVSTGQNCFVAALAGYAQNSTFRDCTVQTRVRLTQSGAIAGVGGLIGFCDESWVYDCAADSELVFLDENQDVDCEEFLGGIFACGCGYVDHCTVKTRGFAEIYGYAHNGGAVGMVKNRRNTSFAPRIAYVTSDTEIAFFEVAPSRRCYCEAILGENCGKICRLTGNKTAHFEKQVSRKAMRIRPDACETPDHERVVTEPTCAEWGYTTVTCRGCGYSYRDDYTEPAHRYEAVVTEPTCAAEGEIVYTCIHCGDRYTETLPMPEHTAEWVEVLAPEPGVEGLEEHRCTVCGAVLGTRPIEALPVPEEPEETVTDILVTPIEAHCGVGEQIVLTAVLEPESVPPQVLVWSSDDPSVATVSPVGVVTTVGEGKTLIRCTLADGSVSGACTVTVSLTTWQWIRHYILFGWLWK